MAEFRKCVLAFAVVALLSSFALPAHAQGTSSMLCTQGAGATPTNVRAEGIAELVGDIVLDCTGGRPTAVGAPVPAANITVNLTVPITSRLVADPFSEVVMLIDEPHTVGNPAGLFVADPGNTNAGVPGTVPGVGTTGTGVTYGSATVPNVYQGRQTAPSQITFFGVPIDPPGTTGHRIVRITNLRGWAQYLGVSSNLTPTTITAFLSVTPSNVLPLNNPQQTVAYVYSGLSTKSSNTSFIQCQGANTAIAGDPSKALGTAASGNQNGQQFTVTFTEGFGSSWKERNIQTHLSNLALRPASATASIVGTVAGATDAGQDVPGSVYASETGFLVNGTAPTGTAPAGFGPFLTAASYSATPRGLAKAGTADAGTRLMITFNSIPNGTQIFVPTRVPLVNTAAGTTTTNAATGFAVLTTTNANGGGTFSEVTPTSGTLGDITAVAAVSVTAGTGTAVYEVVLDDPFQIESMAVPVAVAYANNQGNNLPAPGVQSTVTAGFAPISTVTSASSTAPIPRFAPSGTAINTFIINKCSCNILFPFVTNQQGFDTGVAISNTSADPFGTTGQSGLVTLNYYNGGTAPAAQTTNATVGAGQTVAFTLSGGGNFGIGATPGFQGYIIASAQFQYCHAFAYISAQGALPTAPGASEGYLGIVLDTPFGTATTPVTRTKQFGEVQAH